jgi:DNA polymerase III sliding clamp (beta) subunit (PCNA family)
MRVQRIVPKLYKGLFMYTFTITRSQLKALSLLSADKKDLRVYLQGVYFEPGLTTVKAVSTNGHALIALDLGQFEREAGEGFIMPPELVARFTRFTKREGYDSIVIDYSPETRLIQCTLLGQVTTQPAMDFQYPDWHRVVRGALSPSNESAAFNRKYIEAMNDAAELATLGNAIIHTGGDKSALVQFTNPLAVGIIMPLRVEIPQPNQVLEGFLYNRADQLAREAELVKAGEALAA